jgi:hypothetical protein
MSVRPGFAFGLGTVFFGGVDVVGRPPAGLGEVGFGLVAGICASVRAGGSETDRLEKEFTSETAELFELASVEVFVSVAARASVGEGTGVASTVDAGEGLGVGSTAAVAPE